MKTRIALAALSLLLILVPPAWAVQTRVSVATPAGPPLENATIQIFNTEGQIVAEEETDEEGGVVFDLPAGNYTAETVDGEHSIDLAAGDTVRLTIPELYGILSDIDALTRYFRDLGGSAAELERTLELVDDDIAEQVRAGIDEAGGSDSVSESTDGGGDSDDSEASAESAQGAEPKAGADTATGGKQAETPIESEPRVDPAEPSGPDVTTDAAPGDEAPPSGDPAGGTGSEIGSTDRIDAPPGVPRDSGEAGAGGVAGAEGEGDEIGVGGDLTSRIPDIDYELRPADIEEDDDTWTSPPPTGGETAHGGGVDITTGDPTSLNPPGSNGATNSGVQKMLVEISSDGQSVTIPPGKSATVRLVEPYRLARTSGFPLLEPRSSLGSSFSGVIDAARPTPNLAAPILALTTAPAPAQGGRQAPTDSALQILLTNNGNSTGEAFTAKIFNPGSTPMNIEPGALVVEALKDKAGQKVQKELAKLVGPHMPKLPSLSLDAYCLEFLRLPPAAGTIFRIAQGQIQEQFKQSRSILKASRELYNAGKLHPDIAPEEYFHSIRQWALWTDEQGFDSKSFGDAFIKHTRKNLEAAGGKWNKQYEKVLRGALGGRWNDIQAILEAAGR